MELSDYRYFEHLAQTMHFARTARALGLSPSALTRRVKGMEEELGQLLLLREHREIRLTAAGERFRSFARSQLDQWEELRNELRDEAEHPTGELHIACTVTACHTVLPRLLSEFRRSYPGVTLRLITQDAARSLTQLEAGEVDLAVIPTDDEIPDSLSHIPLGSTDLVFIRSVEASDWQKALSQCPPDLSDIPLIAPISGLERQRLLDWLRARHLEPPIAAEVRGNEGIIALVSLGGGLGLVPKLVLENSPLRDRVCELPELEPPVGYQVSLCTRERSRGRRAVALLWDLAAK